eukprot:8203311-Pyramimonas_sp.AAC.1
MRACAPGASARGVSEGPKLAKGACAREAGHRDLPVAVQGAAREGKALREAGGGCAGLIGYC